jgi:hypothetical protein
MYIRKKLVVSVLFALSVNTSFQAVAFYEVSIEGVVNGLSSYIKTTQNELLNAGTDLIAEHAEDSKQFIEDYNAYTENILVKTSKPISLSGDSDCLANLRSIDIDIIPVDPMDLLKPLKMKLKDLILKSPCEMVTGGINDQIDKIDFAADSPFGSIGARPNLADKQADEEIKRLEKLQRKARVKNMIYDLGSDFQLKVTERRNIVFDADGSIVVPDEDYKVTTSSAPLKTEQLLNKEGLLNMKEVFGEFFSSDEGGNNSNVEPGNSVQSGIDQSTLDAERKAADEAARKLARSRGEN